jgi:hypothetical protein
MKNAICRLWHMYESSNNALLQEKIESGRMLKECNEEKMKAEKRYASLMNDVAQFMDDTDRRVLEANHSKLKEKEQQEMHQLEEKDRMISLMRNEVEVHRNAISEMKQLLKTQGEVMKSKRKQAEEEKAALKEEKKKIEYALYELIQAGDVNKDKMKRIKEICMEE